MNRFNECEIYINQIFQKFTIANLAITLSNPLMFLILLLIGVVYNKNKEYNQIKIKIKSLFIGILGFIFVIFLKNYIKRERPYVKHPEIKLFNNIYVESDYTSFPSGHTYISFVIILLLIDNMNIFLALPLSIALSRIYLGAHYLSDVLFSFFLALFVKSISEKLFIEEKKELLIYLIP